MSSSSVNEMLNKVGKSTFIRYFDYFRKDIDNEQLFKMFDSNNETWNNNSKKIKASQGKRIFKSNLEIDALKLVVEANPSRIGGGEETIAKAKEILNQYIKL